MKNLFYVFAGLLFVSQIARAEVVGPDTMIRNTVQEVIRVIDLDKGILSDQNKILALVDAKVLPHFDFGRMTQLAVGRYWRTATLEQKQALVTEFRNKLVRTYTKVFSVYHDQTVDVKPLKPADVSGDEATVHTAINKPGVQPVLVDYQLKLTADDWKVYDIAIEGVSMVSSYRGTFASQIQQNGIDGLIKTLADNNASAAKVALDKADAK